MVTVAFSMGLEFDAATTTPCTTDGESAANTNPVCSREVTQHNTNKTCDTRCLIKFETSTKALQQAGQILSVRFYVLFLPYKQRQSATTSVHQKAAPENQCLPVAVRQSVPPSVYAPVHYHLDYHLQAPVVTAHWDHARG